MTAVEPLRMGILGCGGIAARHAAAATELGEQVSVVAVADRTLAGARAFSDEMTGGRATVHPSAHDLVVSAGLDILAVCLPPGAHGDEVAFAAERGVHLLLEKPIALRSTDAWAMVEAVERAGVRSQVGFMYRFGAAVEVVRHLQDSGRLGRVGLYDARFFCNALHATWWRDASMSGGQLLEQVIHHVDLMRYLLGEPRTVTARSANLFHTDVPGYSIEDTGAALAAFADGALGALAWSNAAVPGQWDKSLALVAQHATVHLDDPGHGTVTWTSQSGQQEDDSLQPVELTGPDDAFSRQLTDLVTAVRTGGPTRTPVREGARSLDVALAMVSSAAHGGRPVDVPAAP
jgi:predicted dehydrogenase